jgi:Tfp pilus assembly protein PilN
MIKVNLIAEKTQRGRKVVMSVTPSVSRMGLIYAAVLAVTTLGIASYWYSLDRKITTLTESRDRLKAESLRLQNLKKKLTQYEKMKQQRQSRIDVIEKLKESQTGPVLLLNHVIASIPADTDMWLTSLDQKGDRVQINGYTARSTRLPDFMSNLSKAGVFRSVELEVMQEEKEAAKFVLVCLAAQKPRGE